MGARTVYSGRDIMVKKTNLLVLGDKYDYLDAKRVTYGSKNWLGWENNPLWNCDLRGWDERSILHNLDDLNLLQSATAAARPTSCGRGERTAAAFCCVYSTRAEWCNIHIIWGALGRPTKAIGNPGIHVVYRLTYPKGSIQQTGLSREQQSSFFGRWSQASERVDLNLRVLSCN